MTPPPGAVRAAHSDGARAAPRGTLGHAKSVIVDWVERFVKQVDEAHGVKSQ